jgi:hypothetical protein
MPGPLTSQIGRVTTGLLNTVNDAIPAQTTSSGTGATRYGGQLGQRIALGPDEVKFDPTIGNLYGGVYQYVRVAAASTALLRGMILFWDPSVAENLYQVTAVEPTGVSLIAGICLNVITPGNYGFIQIAGRATVKFRAALTKVAAVGDLVLAAAAGAGADNATADVLADATGLTSVQVRHLVGIAEEAPTNGGLKIVRLRANDWHI